MVVDKVVKNREACRRYYWSHCEERRAKKKVVMASRTPEQRERDRIYSVGRYQKIKDVVNTPERRMKERIRYYNRGGYNPIKGQSDVTRARNRRQKRIRMDAGSMTPEIIQSVYESNIKQYGTLTCIYCLNPIAFGDDNLEHKTPLSRGGLNIFSNLGVAHALCNLEKGSMTYEEYMEVIKDRTSHG